MSKTAASGIVALIFLIVGFQAAIFFNKIVQILESEETESSESAEFTEKVAITEVQALPQDTLHHAHYAQKRNNVNREKIEKLKEGRTTLGGYESEKNQKAKRSYESFPFDPNSITLKDLTRLGLTEKQAQSIVNYREKGGRFRQPEDFAKMYVVSDTLFERLKPFIQIPKTELNGADTTVLKGLPGIGSYYAKKIVAYRELLGGFVESEQLLEIDGFTQERYDGLKDYVCVDTLKISAMNIWNKSEDSLAKHPYIGEYAAKSIIRFKSCTDSSHWTIENLMENGVLSQSAVIKIKRYN